jgi:hypothetical protein
LFETTSLTPQWSNVSRSNFSAARHRWATFTLSSDRIQGSSNMKLRDDHDCFQETALPRNMQREAVHASQLQRNLLLHAFHSRYSHTEQSSTLVVVRGDTPKPTSRIQIELGHWALSTAIQTWFIDVWFPDTTGPAEPYRPYRPYRPPSFPGNTRFRVHHGQR